MEEFLTKLNIVKKNNYINKLEKENKHNENKINKYVSRVKEVITEMEIEKRRNLETIKELTENNKKLEDENKSYKYILEKIPNWVIKLFAGKNKNIGGYLYGKK